MDVRSGPDFLGGGGEVGALMRARDWSASPLGSPAAWPPELRTLVGIMLGSKQPMFVAWGDGHALLYNDSYAAVLGRKHPDALGLPFLDVWSEIRGDLLPLVERVGAGEAVHMDDITLVMQRHGYPEETHFAFSWTPVRDADGRVAGIFCACTETTARVLAERRAAFRLALEDRLRDLADPRAVMAAAARALGEHLGADCVGYAEADASGERVTVERDWTAPGGSSVAGLHRLDDYGPAKTAAFRAGRTARIDDVIRSPMTAAAASAYAALGVRSLLNVPLLRADRLDAILFVHAAQPRAWTDEEIRLVEEVAERTRAVVERARAESALRESEARFRNMADHAPVMMWVTDPSGHCTYLNRLWYEFTGQAEVEALGLGWTEATHPEDRQRAADAFLSVNADRAPFRVEYRLRRADGVHRWAIDAASPRFGEDGGFLGYVGSVIDIDERREAEERARESEAATRALAAQQAATLAQLAEGVIATDADGRITLVNDAATRLHGAGRLDVAPDRYATAYSLLTEEGRPYPSLDLPLARAVRGETVLEARWRIRRPDGSQVLAVGNAGPVRDGAGRQVGAVLTIRDDTARRTAEENLERLNDALEERVAERTRERDRVWQNSRDLLVVLGADGVFRAVNPAWTAILGHQPSELVGRSFREFIWPEDADLTERGLEKAASRRDLTSFENRYRHRDGTPRWISWHTTTEGDVIYAYGRHVTAEKEQAEALRQAEEALRQAQKMEAVGQLTGGLAHDFNNLLTGISGSLELLATRLAQGRTGDLERYIGAAQGASRRAAALTHRLLAFSRRQTLDPKPTDVNRLVAGMEELVRRTVGPGVAVEVVAAGGLWTTLVDPNQLENALLNLCINARDAMPDGGRIAIETANKWLDARAARERDLPSGQYLSLCVTDTGTGMTPEVVARAFDPFFTTKPIGMGTGLGLSMIYGFVRQSGGQARIYSEPGGGAMVCLYLPRHLNAAERVEAPAEPAAPPRAARSETVLVVDDEPTVRMLVTEVLEELGYETIEAADGVAGLKVLRSPARLDLLITDVGLPGGLNGRQVADAARALRPDLKVLFITGYAENAVLGHGHLDAGMHVLTKPFAMDALAGRVRDIIAAP